MLRRLKFFTVAILCICIGCNNSKDATIFKKGKHWHYEIVHIDKNEKVLNTVPLEMYVGSPSIISIMSDQIPLNYKYKINNIYYEESTGAIDDSLSRVSIHPPRLAQFSFTEIVPMPSINFPLEIGNITETQIKITKSTFENANGKTIKGTLRLVAIDTLMINGKEIPCFRHEGCNTDNVELFGIYHIIYWFNEQQGFVRIKYILPDGSQFDFVQNEKSQF